MKLSLNCDVEYKSSFLSKIECIQLFDHLIGHTDLTKMLTIETLNKKRIEQNYGKMMFIDNTLFDENRFPETIWGPVHVWSQEMRLLRHRIEEYMNLKFETCVCIYYPDGNSGVGYHSDYPAFGDTTIIPSISLGEERVFRLREKSTLKEHSLLLENGSLVVMGKYCQERYEHSLPVDPKYKQARINLTFRQYGFNNM